LSSASSARIAVNVRAQTTPSAPPASRVRAHAPVLDEGQVVVADVPLPELVWRSKMHAFFGFPVAGVPHGKLFLAALDFPGQGFGEDLDVSKKHAVAEIHVFADDALDALFLGGDFSRPQERFRVIVRPGDQPGGGNGFVLRQIVRVTQHAIGFAGVGQWMANGSAAVLEDARPGKRVVADFNPAVGVQYSVRHFPSFSTPLNPPLHRGRSTPPL
jgi:hypothetical protein